MMDSAVTLELPISVLIIRTRLLFSKSDQLAMHFSVRRAFGKKLNRKKLQFRWIGIFLKYDELLET